MESDPIAGNWYRHVDKGECFQVVDIDEEAGNIEIQYFDGALDTVDLEEWYEMQIEAMEPPEDWTGPVDDIERDDLGYTETDMTSEDWSESTRENVPKPPEAGENEEATDEWGEERHPKEQSRKEED